MHGQIILTLGVAFVGAVLGYMVGGSASPVVSVAIPAIFGLAMMALGLMQPSLPNKEILELLIAHGDKVDSIPEVVDNRSRAKTAPRRIGVSLITFSIAYLIAATLGSKVRIDNLLTSKVNAPPFPWETSKVKPENISIALEWIALQGRLRDLGYDDSQIDALFELQVQDWKNRVAITNSPCLDSDKPTTNNSKAPNNIPSLENLLKQTEAPKGKPFANQPPKDLMDKLKELKQPGSATQGPYPG